MAIEKGDIRTSVNYEVMAKKALDARTVKPSKVSLFDKESWSYDGDSVYIYNGMQVFVEEEKKTYVLVDETKFDTEEGWELLGTGTSSEMEQVEVIDKLDSIRDDAALSANQGRILSDRIEEVAGEATKIYGFKGSTEYAKLPMTGNKVGDVYSITDDFTLGGVSYSAGTNVVWDGSNWDALGGSFDLSDYYNKEEVADVVRLEKDRAMKAETLLQGTTSNLWVAVNDKVDKVSGKGLSTEDFTPAFKRKLDELENYNDEDIRNDIESLQSQLNTLTNSDDIEEVITKYEELKALLEGMGNDEYGAFVEEISERIVSLEASLKSTNLRIDPVIEEVERLEADKQEALTSGVNIKTINHQSILGSGNLDLEVGTTSIEPALVIYADKDFDIKNGSINTTGGVITDKNITYDKVREAVDNGRIIALTEIDGNTSYCVRAEYAIPNQNGEKRIMLFFSWRIGDEEYAAVLYVGLDSSLTYMKWKLDLATKEYVDGAIEDIPIGGGGITEEKEVYIGTTPTEEAKIWIDPTGTPSGGGSTAEPELRPLYVPDLNATLTDEQMAYNEETCQKMLEGTAIAVVTNGEMSSYSDSIIDLTPQGAEGYVVSFKGVGGVYVIGGDVMVTLPDVSTSATIPEDITAEDASDITNLVIAIAIAGSLGSFPACYLEKGDIRRLFQQWGESMGIIILNIEYYDVSTRVVSTYLLAGDGSGGGAVTFRYPTEIYLAPTPADTKKEANVDWMKTRHNIPREVPTLKYGEIGYYPISINRYASNTGYADFTIYRDGAFETWRMMDDGSTTKL